MTRSLLQLSVILVITLHCTLSSAQLSVDELIINDAFPTNTTTESIDIGLSPNSPNRESGPLSNGTIQPSQSPSPSQTLKICEAGFDCVPYFLCKDNFIISDGIGIIDIRFDEDCTDTMKVCCAVNNVTDTPLGPIVPITAPKSKPKPTPSPSPLPEPFPAPLPAPLPEPLPSPLPPTLNGCGMRNIDGIAIRIVGGTDNETQFAEFPWMVAVLRREQTIGEENLIYQCGGSLINPSVVVTAAHCVSGLPTNNLKIRAGEWDTKTILEPFPHQDRDVGQVIVHEDFQKANLRNDIALIFLVTPLDLAENVRPVCLPPVDAKFDDRRCFATGWGKDKYGAKGKNPAILKKIDLPIVPQEKCLNSLRSTRLSRYFELHDSFICAGGEEGKDTCKGDGGSPLVCTMQDGDNQYYQAGIVSWGIGCADNSIPGVYVNVMKFRPWIDQIMSDKNLDKLSYVP